MPIRILLLLALLSLSLFVTGICGALLVWRSHRAYQAIVARELPTLALLRDITRQGSATRRAVNTYTSAEGATSRAEKYRDFEAAIEANNKNLEKLAELMTDEGSVAFQKLIENRISYIEAARSFMFSIESGKGIAHGGEQQHLEDLYRVYLDNQDSLADYAENQATQKSLKITREGRALYFIFLLVALWPVLIALLFFAYGVITTAFSLLQSRRS